MPIKTHQQLVSYVYGQIKALLNTAKPTQILVALSGGLDSTVLLHVVACLQKQFNSFDLSALHVDHGIHPDSSDWAEQCHRFCTENNIPFVLEKHNLDNIHMNRESYYRKVRYRCFSAHLKPAGILLTAHHQRDQVETVLFNLFRGGGLSGLRGMQARREFANGLHLRPLLSVSQDLLIDYANYHDLEWIDDPSNLDIDFDRNYIRHEILPKIVNRWPAAQDSIFRSTQIVNQTKAVMDELAQTDIELACTDQFPGVVTEAYVSVMDLSKVKQHSTQRKLNLLKYWIETNTDLVISSAQLSTIHEDLCHPGKSALFDLKGIQLRSFNGFLYLMTSLPEPDVDYHYNQPSNGCYVFDLHALKLTLRPDQNINLEFKKRTGGEKIIFQGQTKSVKNLYNENSVPPWERHWIPLIYSSSQLMAIPGVALADACPFSECFVCKI